MDECEICQTEFTDIDPAVQFSHDDGYLVCHFTCGDNLGMKPFGEVPPAIQHFLKEYGDDRPR